MGGRPLYITEGDPAGISYELVSQEISLLTQISRSRPVYLFRGLTDLKYLGFQEVPPPHSHGSLGMGLPPEPGLYSIAIAPPEGGVFSVQPGQPSTETGLASYLALKSCLTSILDHPGDLVTLPLSKEWVIRSGQVGFSGHTEELARVFDRPSFMLMLGKTWKVLPLTTHIPLRRVSEELEGILWDECLASILDSRLFPGKIRIAYLGLNPHAGEGGKIGDEESRILSRRLDAWRSDRVDVVGPLSADSAFLDPKPNWDMVLACYHDQGLIPFKILEGKDGINCTLGLPIQRVSPDHGPAYSIAGKGIADSRSFAQCLDFLIHPEDWV